MTRSVALNEDVVASIAMRAPDPMTLVAMSQVSPLWRAGSLRASRRWAAAIAERFPDTDASRCGSRVDVASGTSGAGREWREGGDPHEAFRKLASAKCAWARGAVRFSRRADRPHHADSEIVEGITVVPETAGAPAVVATASRGGTVSFFPGDVFAPDDSRAGGEIVPISATHVTDAGGGEAVWSILAVRGPRDRDSGGFCIAAACKDSSVRVLGATASPRGSPSMPPVPTGSPVCAPGYMHHDAVFCVATAGNRDGATVFATGSWDGSVRVWTLSGSDDDGDGADSAFPYTLSSNDGAVIEAVANDAVWRFAADPRGSPGTLWCGTWDLDHGLCELAVSVPSAIRRIPVPTGEHVVDLATSRFDGRIHGCTRSGKYFALDPRSPEPERCEREAGVGRILCDDELLITQARGGSRPLLVFDIRNDSRALASIDIDGTYITALHPGLHPGQIFAGDDRGRFLAFDVW